MDGRNDDVTVVLFVKYISHLERVDHDMYRSLSWEDLQSSRKIRHRSLWTGVAYSITLQDLRGVLR